MFRSMIKVLAAGALSLTLVANAAAQTADDAVVTVIPQTNAVLSASITGEVFPDVTYSFADQTTQGQIGITALDPRGTQAGWNVTLSGTDFAGTTNPTNTFAVSNLSLSQGTVSVVAGQATPLPTSIALPAVSTTAIKVMSAPVGSGAGQYQNDVPATLNVPGGTLVDTYKSTLTVSITTGP